MCRESPSLKAGLCYLSPLWKFYHMLLAAVSPAYCDVPPIVRALTELFYTAENLAIVSLIIYLPSMLCLNLPSECFDTVGWAAGKASGLSKNGGWWRWALVSPDGVAPSPMVGVSASVGLPLHHKVQKFSSGTSSPGWSRKKGRKMVVVVACCV